MKKQTAIIPEKFKSKPVFHPAGLGLCEHCQTLVSIQGMPAEAMDAEWNCPKCNRVLTEKTFGYKNGKKVLWVGKDGKWVEKEPEGSFDLNDWHISKEIPIF